MVQNCNKIINDVICVIKQLIYDYIAENVYIVKSGKMLSKGLF